MVASVDILRGDGSLDRKSLAELVFSDMSRKQKLDEIMFKAIIAEVDRQVEAAYAMEPVGIMIDAPLLFEAGLDDRCDLIILMVADLDTRVHRVCMRDGATEQEVISRINSQMSDEEKKLRSDIIIDNSGPISQLEEALKTFFTKFSKNS